MRAVVRDVVAHDRWEGAGIRLMIPAASGHHGGALG
jgi:hypothetical protein